MSPFINIEEAIKDLTTERAAWTDENIRIEEARIETIAGRSHVWGANGGVEKVVFSFYPDELTFHEGEFVGLTVGEARALHMKRDIEWLQTP